MRANRRRLYAIGIAARLCLGLAACDWAEEQRTALKQQKVGIDDVPGSVKATISDGEP